MNEIYFDDEPTETETKILNLRTKLEIFKTHLLTAKTKREQKIAMDRIRVIQAEIHALTYNENDEIVLLEEN